MTVELINKMGGDLSIVNAARVSHAKESNYESDGTLNVADQGLINYLMKNRHGTPFEMVQFQFRITVPIGVAREWQRHRIGSFNEVSTRYVEMKPDFYLPLAEDVRVQVGKVGHYTFEPADEKTASTALTIMQTAYYAAYEGYEQLLKLGVAKELARNVLPLALMTQFIWSVNLRSLFNFMSLRSHPTALLEIRKESHAIENIVAREVPIAYNAWIANGKVVP